MLGSGNPTPYDVRGFVALVLLSAVLACGAVIGGHWQFPAALLVRRGASACIILVMAAVYIWTPTTNGIVGAARLLFLWTAAVIGIVLFGVWSWRAGTL